MDISKDSFRIAQPVGYGRTALVVGLVSLAASAVGWWLDSSRFYFGYLVAFTFWVSLSLGALFFVMLHHLVNAQWSVVIRRVAEALMAPIPLLGLLFIPLIFGMHDLFEWTHTEVVAQDHILLSKEPWLNQTFFVIRAVVYFAIWSYLAHRLYRLSVASDDGLTRPQLMAMRKTSAYGMLLFSLTITFAGFDWLMSLNPHWYSTIFGVYYFSGGLLGVVCLLIVLTMWMRKRGILTKEITTEHYHDLGKLMFGFIIFWGYIGFSQYLLIWYANIPEETIWYLDRWDGTWKYVSLLLLFGSFAVPFCVMIFRNVKRALGFQAFVAIWLLVMHWVDLYWIVLPTYTQHMGLAGAHFSWIDVATMFAIGGLFFWAFWLKFVSQPTVPVGDPKLIMSIEHVTS